MWTNRLYYSPVFGFRIFSRVRSYLSFRATDVTQSKEPTHKCNWSTGRSMEVVWRLEWTRDVFLFNCSTKP